MIDLRMFYITLPTGKPGAPTTVKPPLLETLSVPPWFHRTPEGLYLFRANCGGVTTSGSAYARSELRELNPDGSLAKWSTRRGRHEMHGRSAILAAPKVKPQVVFNQIHGGSDDLTVEMYDGFKDGIRWKQGDTTKGLILPDYDLGQFFDWALIAEKGYIEHYINGDRVARFAKSSDTCYFKLGCYTQSNVAKGDSPDAYGEVAVEWVRIIHS